MIRFYFNDFTMCADIDWDASVYPQKGDIILLKEFIDLEKGKSNVKFFTEYEGMCSVYSVHKGDSVIYSCYIEAKDINEVTVESGPIWRIINGVQTICFTIKPSAKQNILDAYLPNEKMN